MLKIELFDNLTVCINKICLQITYLIYVYKESKVGNLSRRWPEGSFFNSYYAEV